MRQKRVNYILDPIDFFIDPTKEGELQLEHSILLRPTKFASLFIV